MQDVEPRLRRIAHTEMRTMAAPAVVVDAVLRLAGRQPRARGAHR